MTTKVQENHLSESIEDYLEAILVLSDKLPAVRSVDVASYLGLSKPSVHHAVKIMQEEGLLDVIAPGKFLQLTPQGMTFARETYRRHVFFTNMLEEIGVPSEIAESDACRIEHIISQETLDAIQRFYEKAEPKSE